MTARRGELARDLVWSAFALVMCGALLYAAWGVLSIVLARDVIDDPGMPVVLGLSMCAAALLVCGGAVLLAMRAQRRTGRTPWAQAVLGCLCAWGAYAATALAWAAALPSPPPGRTAFSYAWERAGDPFGSCVPVLVLSIVLAACLLRAGDERTGRTGGRG